MKIPIHYKNCKGEGIEHWWEKWLAQVEYVSSEAEDYVRKQWEEDKVALLVEICDRKGGDKDA